MTTSADAARAEYERAIAYDREGFEAEAIPHYEAGAPARARATRSSPGALLGLGSSLRNVARADEAVAVLTDACKRFPDDAALRALPRARARERRTVRVRARRDDPARRRRIDAEEIRRYRRALDEYADELAPR